MEDQLFAVLYHLVHEEYRRRPRPKSVQYTDAGILLVVFWAVLHDRPMCWACQPRHWPQRWQWLTLPSPQRLSERLRTLSVQLLLEQVVYLRRKARDRQTGRGGNVVGHLPDPSKVS